jgi:hypothetical protein
MAYIVNRFNGTQLTVVEDGKIIVDMVKFKTKTIFIY